MKRRRELERAPTRGCIFYAASVHAYFARARYLSSVHNNATRAHGNGRRGPASVVAAATAKVVVTTFIVVSTAPPRPARSRAYPSAPVRRARAIVFLCFRQHDRALVLLLLRGVRCGSRNVAINNRNNNEGTRTVPSFRR